MGAFQSESYLDKKPMALWDRCGMSWGKEEEEPGEKDEWV